MHEWVRMSYSLSWHSTFFYGQWSQLTGFVQTWLPIRALNAGRRDCGKMGLQGSLLIVLLTENYCPVP